MPHHKAMVPPGFAPPERLETDHFILRPLLFTDGEADYEAWSTSVEHLHGVFGPGSDWPSLDMTLQENAIDLAWHQREHENASSFAFTVLDHTETRCIGCVYFSPARKVGYDTEVFYWVRASELGGHMEESLGKAVLQWLAQEWPFKSIVLPGRDIAWDEYLSLEDQPHW